MTHSSILLLQRTTACWFMLAATIGARSAPVLPGGSNDECATAVAVEVTAECAGSIGTYDASSATTSQPASTCSGSTSSDAQDLWFNFMATGPVTRVVVEGTLSFDPVVEGFSGSCGDLVSMGCTDVTFPASVPTSTTEVLTLHTVEGSTYFVRVYPYTLPQPEHHSFSLCIFEPELPSNDECSNVAPVALTAGSELSFTGDNTDCTDTEGLGLPQVWHAFSISECMDVTVDLCGTSPAFLNWSQRLYGSCLLEENTVLESSSEQVSCGDGNTTILFNNVRPGTYYFPVVRDDSPGTLAIGPYALRISGELATDYCDAALLECDETIGRVTIGGIDNASGCSVGGVVDYTAQSTDIDQGGSLAVTVLNGGAAYMDDSVTVFVDWDRDLTFCEENEAYVLSSDDDGATFTGTVECPADAPVGATRLRVRMAYGSPARPCGIDRFGEIEDYTINVLLGNGVREQNKRAFTVFPNPGTGDLNIYAEGMNGMVTIELIDVAGRAVIRQVQRFSEAPVFLGLSGAVSSGSYVLHLVSDEGRLEQQVIVR